MALELLRTPCGKCFTQSLKGAKCLTIAQSYHFAHASSLLASTRCGIRHRKRVQTCFRGYRMQTTVAHSERLGLPLNVIIADGTTAYPGKVVARMQTGALVDFGAECNGFLAVDNPLDGPDLGEEVVVYPVRKWRNGEAARIDVALHPSMQPGSRWTDIHGDGVTPLKGRIAALRPSTGLLVDVGTDKFGYLPQAELERYTGAPLIEGSDITVYVVFKDKKTGRLDLSLQPQQIPRSPWESLVPDGQTPYRGRVLRSVGVAYVVDINSEVIGFLPASEVEGTLDNDQEITVYICKMERKNWRLTLSMQRRDRPLQRWDAIIADGVTPYVGLVNNKANFGVFIDLGAEVMGLIPSNGFWAAEPQALDDLYIGQEVTVYVVQKMASTGKLTISLKCQPKPLLTVADICADGITPYKGVVYNECDFGLFVFFGLHNIGLLARAKQEEAPLLFEHRKGDFTGLDLAPGRSVEVYVVKINPISEKISLSLWPSDHRRLSLDEVQLRRTYTGTVYHVSFNEILVDFGSAISGCLVREEAPHASRGDPISVQPTGFDRGTGRFNLQLTNLVSNQDEQKSKSDSDSNYSEVRWIAERSQAGETVRLTCLATGQTVSQLPTVGWVEVRNNAEKPYYWNLSSGTCWPGIKCSCYILARGLCLKRAEI